MTTKQFKKKLQKIQFHYEMIWQIFLTIPQEQRDWILEVHNENTTLQYCNRRWLQAVDDLLKNLE